MGEDNFWMNPALRHASRRRVLAAAVAGGAGLTLLGCSSKKNAQPPAGAGRQSGSQASETPQTGGTFVAYTASNFPLDPQKVSAGAQRVVGGVMSRVFRFKTGLDPQVIADHDIENDLGISAESPDAITWTVKLRTGAKFANIAPVNGHAVEAEDVKATFVRALDPATGDPNRGALNMLDPAQIQTPAKDTVVFRLSYPFAPFTATLASPAYSWIFPREVLAGGYDPSKVMIGSGPFTLDSAQPDVVYTYKKNPDYF